MTKLRTNWVKNYRSQYHALGDKFKWLLSEESIIYTKESHFLYYKAMASLSVALTTDQRT